MSEVVLQSRFAGTPYPSNEGPTVRLDPKTDAERIKELKAAGWVEKEGKPSPPETNPISGAKPKPKPKK